MSRLIASSSAALWNAIDSSAARAMCAIVEPRVRPTMVPRASGFQCGAPSPVNAGTNITPPLSGTLAASCCTSLLERIAFRPSRSHCTTAPPMKTLPSRANWRVAAGCAALVAIRPFAEGSKRSPVFISMKQPVPYVFLTCPGRKHAWPKSALCWSPQAPPIAIGAPKIAALV
jgi:hypothetical protein